MLPKSFVAIIFFAICAVATAQNSEITLYAGGLTGDSFIAKPPALFPEVRGTFGEDFTGGFRYAYFFNSKLAGEIGAGFSPSSILASVRVNNGSTSAASIVNVDTYVMHANMTAHLVNASVIPYLTGGVAAVHFAFNTASFGYLTPSETDFAWNAGGGLKIPIRKDTALRFDGRVYWMKPEFALEDTTQFEEFSGGISILFDF